MSNKGVRDLVGTRKPATHCLWPVFPHKAWYRTRLGPLPLNKHRPCLMVITAVLHLNWWIAKLNRCISFCVEAEQGKCNELHRVVSTLSPWLIWAPLTRVIHVPVSQDQVPFWHTALCYHKYVGSIYIRIRRQFFRYKGQIQFYLVFWCLTTNLLRAK